MIEASLGAQLNNLLPALRARHRPALRGQPHAAAAPRAGHSVPRGQMRGAPPARRPSPPAAAPRADDMPAPNDHGPFAVTVLVTDGFQSTATPFQPGATGRRGVHRGGRPELPRGLLPRASTRGYGLWVGRLHMGFNGRYGGSPERRIDAAMWSRTSPTSRRSTPTRTGTASPSPPPPQLRGGPTADDTGRRPSRSGGDARPMLVFVLTRDVAGPGAGGGDGAPPRGREGGASPCAASPAFLNLTTGRRQASASGRRSRV